MRRRSIVDFEVNLTKQIEDDEAELVAREADIQKLRVRIDTLKGVQAGLKNTAKVEDVKETAEV